MSVLDELSDLRQRAEDRLKELEPLVAEYQQLQAVLARLGTEGLGDRAAAKPATRRRAAKARDAELLERFGLSDAGARVAKTYSVGVRLEVHLADENMALEAAWVLGGMVDTAPQIDGRSVRLPVEDRGGALMEAVRRLDEAKLSVDDVAVRRPTLDDVFLTLTGHEAEAEAEREEVAA